MKISRLRILWITIISLGIGFVLIGFKLLVDQRTITIHQGIHDQHRPSVLSHQSAVAVPSSLKPSFSASITQGEQVPLDVDLKKLSNVSVPAEVLKFSKIMRAPLWRKDLDLEYWKDKGDGDPQRLSKVKDWQAIPMLRMVMFCIQKGIRGDFLEAGVWLGGNSMSIQFLLKYVGVEGSRRLWVVDSFMGFGEGNEDQDEIFNRVDNSAGGLDVVVYNFKTHKLFDDNVVFLEGFFQESLQLLGRDEVFALIRLDADMYTSTTQLLCSLYDHLSVGGFVIIDDWGHWPQAKRAVIDFLNQTKVERGGQADENVTSISMQPHRFGKVDIWHLAFSPDLEDMEESIKKEDSPGPSWWQKRRPSRARTSAFCQNIRVDAKMKEEEPPKSPDCSWWTHDGSFCHPACCMVRRTSLLNDFRFYVVVVSLACCGCAAWVRAKRQEHAL